MLTLPGHLKHVKEFKSEERTITEDYEVIIHILFVVF